MTFLSVLVLLVSIFSPCRAFVIYPKADSIQLSGASFSRTRLQAASSSTTTTRDELVQDLLTTARSVGQVGSMASPENQELLLEKAQQLQKYSDAKPARVQLTGVHDLVYSAAPGGSSGKLVGPIYGKVQQTFLDDDSTFINSVSLGPIEIALRASCETKSDTVTKVSFHETTVSIFGKEVVKKEISGGGAWNYLFLGEIQDTDGMTKLVRVMQTPSLFIIEQPIIE